MPNELAKPVEQQPPPAPVTPPADEGPSRDEVLAALRQEHAANEALYMENARLRQPVSPAPPDPLDRYATEGLALPAGEQKNLLDEAIRRRADESAMRAAAEVDRRAALRDMQRANENALNTVMAQHPDIADPKNHPKFAAAMFEVEMENRQKGITLSPLQLAQQAAQKYRANVQPNAAAPAPPFVEGSGNPSMPGAGGAPAEPELNALEEVYGLPAGTIKPLVNPEKQLQEETERFIRDGNAEMFKRGVRSNMRGISQTLIAKAK